MTDCDNQEMSIAQVAYRRRRNAGDRIAEERIGLFVTVWITEIFDSCVLVGRANEYHLALLRLWWQVRNLHHVQVDAIASLQWHFNEWHSVSLNREPALLPKQAASL